MSTKLQSLKIALFLLALPLTAFGQTEFTIVWDGTPGQLENTIAADTMQDGTQASDIYILEKGKIYLQIDPLEPNSSYTVRGEAYDAADPADLPATIQPLPGPDGANRLGTFGGGHWQLLTDDVVITIENILFNGAMADQSTHVWSIATTKGANQGVVLENVIMSEYQMGLTALGQDSDFMVNNSVYKNTPSYPGGVFFNGFIWGGGSWMGTIDELKITNSTIANTFGEAIVVYEQVREGLVDHTSFINIVMDPIWYRGGNNMTFSNNLFYNTQMYGQSSHWFGLWGSVEGGHGVMAITEQPADTASTNNGMDARWDHEDRGIHWHHNAWARDQQVLDFWAGGPWEWQVTEVVNGDSMLVTRNDTMYDISQQNVFLSDSALVLIASNPSSIMANDNVETWPTLLLDPRYAEAMLDRILDFRDNEVFDTYLDEWWQFDNDGMPTTVEWPMHEDFRYPLNAAAARASETGGPVGDPRFMPFDNVAVINDAVPRFSIVLGRS